MEKWRRVWREGLVPVLAPAGLIVLQAALERNDPRLLQGRISCPPPIPSQGDCPVYGACSIGYCGWQGDGLNTTAQVEAYFHDICDAVDAAFNEPAACRYFLHWYDDTPRTEMRRELLSEVRLALARVAPAAA